MICLTTEMTPKIDEEGVAFSLRSRDYKDPQCVVIENHPADSRVKISKDGMVQTLSSRMGTGGGNTPIVLENHPMDSRMKIKEDGIFQTMGVRGGQEYEPHTLMVMEEQMENYIVRRLTPLECERLQGFPDGWTDIGDWTDSKGKLHKGESDSPRYKALGNSIALPFWEWMAKRMVEQLRKDGVEEPTMASLFDGIGGFPLAYQRAGCEPVWASEIEEFPMAVTMVRFPEKVEE